MNRERGAHKHVPEARRRLKFATRQKNPSKCSQPTRRTDTHGLQFMLFLRHTCVHDSPGLPKKYFEGTAVAVKRAPASASSVKAGRIVQRKCSVECNMVSCGSYAY